MAYQEAVEAAGAIVHAWQEFGSYQGDWWARVTLADGRTGWITGSYGSCSGCDAFEASFGYAEDSCDKHSYRPNSSCQDCATKKAAHVAKLAAFGVDYLDHLLSQEQAEKKAGENIEWDSEAPDMLAFVKSNPVPVK